MLVFLVHEELRETRVTEACKEKKGIRVNEDQMDLKVTLVLRASVEMLDLKDKSVWRDPRGLR